MKFRSKALAFSSGVLCSNHRARNRNPLTVVMFHRPAVSRCYTDADAEWTMTPNSLARCLSFCRNPHHVVSPEQVYSALRGAAYARANRRCSKNLNGFPAQIRQHRGIAAAAAAKTFDLLASLCHPRSRAANTIHRCDT